MATFKKGDVVQLKSGGPSMVVSAITNQRAALDNEPIVAVTCSWFAGEEFKSITVDSEVLSEVNYG